MPGPPDELERARAFLAVVDERVVDELREWSGGAVLLTPALPTVWDANYFRLDARANAAPRAIATEASAIAADAGIDHVALVVDDERSARRLAPALGALGFEQTRLILMALREPPSAAGHDVVEANFAAVAPSRREISLEASPGDEVLADQLAELDRRLERAVGGRWFVIRDGGGIAARAWLRGEGGVGQVEDVATAPAHRGRGLARAVVGAASRASVEAGDGLTFVVADADDTTPRMYRKLGFEPIGLTHRFVRSAAR